MLDQETHVDAAATGIDELVRIAHERTVNANDQQIAEYLQRILGQRTTAIIAGAKDPKIVGKWIRSEQEPRAVAAARLRIAYQVAMVLAQKYNDRAVGAWFIQMNPFLDDL